MAKRFAQSERRPFSSSRNEATAYTSEILRELGYFVIEAASGSAALESLARHPVDLLFTDVVMPGGINGRQL